MHSVILIETERAESQKINSAGQRPAKRNIRKWEALNGRNQLYTYDALSGLLTSRGDLFHSALPCDNIFQTFCKGRTQCATTAFRIP
jgi:hypothetical protein